jgi:glycosyltransferase involved in cell wall biosynthesis
MAELQQLCREAGLGARVTFKGFTSDAEKLDLYAQSLGIIYPPVDEDYGYVTLEAMLSRKPVITTLDSGGPLEFVEHDRTGLVCAPDAAALAAQMDELWRHRSIAARMGEAGRGFYDSLSISWDRVVEVLTA